nr:hypothetical protein [Candidatus Gracilibacteria bacterium]
MTENKNPKFVIAGSVLTLTIMIMFALIFLLYIYPNIEEIQNEKNEVKGIVDNYENIKLKGISYEDFRAQKLSGSKLKDLYLQNILKEVDINFYKNNFENAGKENFDTFMTNKQKEINEKKNNPDFINSLELNKKILPSYTESYNQDDSGIMTDFKFITYVESILHTFNLEPSDKGIGIGDLNLLPKYNITSETKSGLESNIYYIPYTFNITGLKKDVVDFIYFLENVGSVTLLDNQGIKVGNDSFINKSLDGFGGNNILENPIIDIQSIDFPKYFNSLSTVNNDSNFLEFLKKTQGNEKISVMIDVRFYVKGLPEYKVKESVMTLSSSYDSLLQDYTNLMTKNKQSGTIPSEDLVNVEKGLKYLQELGDKIKELKADTGDINIVYSKVIEYNKILSIIENIIKKYK